jgi:hypothetical protein
MGSAPKSGFKKEAWLAVLPKVQACIVQVDEAGSFRRITQAQAANKVSDYKVLYGEWRLLQDASGLGYDPETGLFTATDDVWEAWIKVSVISSSIESITYRVGSSKVQKASR